MDAVASRAGASKETLYTWFGSRDDLLAAVVESGADASVSRVRESLAGLGRSPEEMRSALTLYARALLTLLTGPVSIELNRAAVLSPALAERLLVSGRHRVGPVVETYLAEAATLGLLEVPDPGEAYRTLYGLVVRDSQIRTLLGEPPPSADEVERVADAAVEAFLTVHRGSALPDRRRG